MSGQKTVLRSCLKSRVIVPHGAKRHHVWEGNKRRCTQLPRHGGTGRVRIASVISGQPHDHHATCSCPAHKLEDRVPTRNNDLGKTHPRFGSDAAIAKPSEGGGSHDLLRTIPLAPDQEESVNREAETRGSRGERRWTPLPRRVV